jgi:hypothetical protein
MSQKCVESVIGKLVTDEQFRRRFAEDPEGVLQELTACGLELSAVEMRALAGVDADAVARLADALDPRIQKADVCGGRPRSAALFPIHRKGARS